MRSAARASAALALAAALAAPDAPRAALPEALGEVMPVIQPVGLIGFHLYDGAFVNPLSVYWAAGEIYVADQGNRLIGIFDDRGYPVFAFGGKDAFEMARKVVVDRRGRIVVLDGNERIRVFSYRGVLLEELDRPELRGLGGRPSISTITIDPDGHLVAVNEELQEVLVYDGETGRLRGRFGGRGLGAGRFAAIAAVVADADGYYVLDQVGVAIQVFDRKGHFVRGWGQHDIGPEDFSLPSALAVDPRGWIIAADGIRGELKVFDKRGRFLGRTGSFGTDPGQLAFPSDMAVDPAGRLVVADKGNGRVQIFRVEERKAPASPPRGEEGGGKGPPQQGPDPQHEVKPQQEVKPQ